MPRSRAAENANKLFRGKCILWIQALNRASMTKKKQAQTKNSFCTSSPQRLFSHDAHQGAGAAPSRTLEMEDRDRHFAFPLVFFLNVLIGYF